MSSNLLAVLEGSSYCRSTVSQVRLMDNNVRDWRHSFTHIEVIRINTLSPVVNVFRS